MFNQLLPEGTYQDIKSKVIRPEDWMNHLRNDLLKYWDTEDAVRTEQGLFHTYRANDGSIMKADGSNLSPEYIAALNNPDTQGLVEMNKNYIRAHSRQTYAYGIAFHMTGKKKYLELCRQGALALVNAMDGNYGMYVQADRTDGTWDQDRNARISQDLSYGLTGLGMYYLLTRDKGIMHKIIQVKDYIFQTYMDDSKGYLTWLPKSLGDKEVQIVAQLDQLYAYMLMVTPALPEPYQGIWKKDMKKICDILITQFYSQHYGFFWGVESSVSSMRLGSDHTDFGHSVKTFWVIQKIGELLGDPFYIEFARPKINNILKEAYIEEDGTWARRLLNEEGEIDKDKEWWILAELDQAAEILSIHDPYYYKYLNTTQKFWLETMVDHEHGEIWHMVSGEDHQPVLSYPKIHSWKTSLHSFEHVLFSYMTACRMCEEDITLYYAFSVDEKPCQESAKPYMFFANFLDYEIVVDHNKIDFMPDENCISKVRFNGLH
ncbi:MAG: hypothetical protein R3Y67_05915 [Eubacteriales bacterium]